MENSTTLATDTTVHYVLAAFLGVLVLVSLVLNFLFSVAFCRVHRLRKAPNWFLLNLIAVDLLATVTWVGPSVGTAATWDWLLGDIYCQIQGVMSTLCYYVNLHMFVIIAMEKAIRFCYPSKHKATYFGTSVLMVILSVWLLDLVIALSYLPVGSAGLCSTNSPMSFSI